MFGRASAEDGTAETVVATCEVGGDCDGSDDPAPKMGRLVEALGREMRVCAPAPLPPLPPQDLPRVPPEPEPEHEPPPREAPEPAPAPAPMASPKASAGARGCACRVGRGDAPLCWLSAPLPLLVRRRR